jgi:hypothetical protein
VQILFKNLTNEAVHANLFILIGVPELPVPSINVTKTGVSK